MFSGLFIFHLGFSSCELSLLPSHFIRAHAMENDTSQMKNGKSKDLKTFASLLKIRRTLFLPFFLDLDESLWVNFNENYHGNWEG